MVDRCKCQPPQFFLRRSPNPFTTFLSPPLVIEKGERKKLVIDAYVPIASVESQRLWPAYWPTRISPWKLRSFCCLACARPRSMCGTSRTRWQGTLVEVEGAKRGWLSRALFSDNVSRIETALKQPINAVTRPSWAACSLPTAFGANFVRFQEIVVRSRNGVWCRALNQQTGAIESHESGSMAD